MDSKLLTGWFLGLLSSMTMSLWQESRKKSQACRGIRTELIETRLGCCSIAFSVACRAQQVNSDFLRWTKSELAAYAGHYPKEKTESVLDGILDLPDNQIEAAATAFNTKGPGGLSIPSVGLPFTTAHTADIALLSSTCQYAILSSIKSVGIINDKAKQIDHWEKYTFSAPSDDNYIRAIANSNASMIALITAARQACKNMEDAVTRLSNFKIFFGAS